MKKDSKVLFCSCVHSDIITEEKKHEVLRRIAESGTSFDVVPDLCELAARSDPLLKRFANGASVKIIACYPRTVRCLFASAQLDLPEGTEILNMREMTPAGILTALNGEGKTE